MSSQNEVWATREICSINICSESRYRSLVSMKIPVDRFEELTGFTILPGKRKRLRISFGRGKTIYLTRSNRDFYRVWRNKALSKFICCFCAVEFHKLFPALILKPGTCVRLRITVVDALSCQQ